MPPHPFGATLETATCHTLTRLSHVLQDQRVRFGTASLEEAQQHLRTQDGSIALRVDDPASFRSYRELQIARLPSVRISLGCIDAGGGYDLAFQSRDEMLVNIPLRGRGWVGHGTQSVAMSTGQILLVGPCCRVVKHWDGPGQVLGLHIPLSELEAARNRASDPGLPLYLPPVTLIDHARLQTLLGFVELLVDEGGVEGDAFGGTAVAEHAERLLIGLLMEGLRLALPPAPDAVANAAGERAAAKPYYVRRAEDYVRAHASNEIGVDDMAAVAGVSRRTLQYGFRKVHGSTPMLYLKKVRLEQARAALRDAAQRQRRVSDIAADSGCFNVSQFSRDYRAMFGESPSETAAAPRQLAGGLGINPEPVRAVAPDGKACAPSTTRTALHS